MTPLSSAELQAEIKTAESALADLGDRELRLWKTLCISPAMWEHGQYPSVGSVWVVAVMGLRCLYYNQVEGGWGWGRFDSWGVVTEYHWQQDDIQHVIAQTLFDIDHGGTG
jgi:hypothetical protein